MDDLYGRTLLGPTSTGQHQQRNCAELAECTAGSGQQPGAPTCKEGLGLDTCADQRGGPRQRPRRLLPTTALNVPVRRSAAAAATAGSYAAGAGGGEAGGVTAAVAALDEDGGGGVGGPADQLQLGLPVVEETLMSFLAEGAHAATGQLLRTYGSR